EPDFAEPFQILPEHTTGKPKPPATVESADHQQPSSSAPVFRFHCQIQNRNLTPEAENNRPPDFLAAKQKAVCADSIRQIFPFLRKASHSRGWYWNIRRQAAECL